MQKINKKKYSRKIYLNKEKGSILAYALIMMMIVSIILVSMLQYINSQIQLGTHRLEKEKAFHIAEAGIYQYRWYLTHNISGKTATQINDFWNGSPSPIGVGESRIFEYIDKENNEVLGSYEINVTPPSTDSPNIFVKSTGWTNKEPSIKRTVQVRFRRPAWSEYMLVSDSFMSFDEQMTVYGKVHSNVGIHFDGLAYGTVSALPPSFDDPDYGGNTLDFGVYTSTDPTAPIYPWPEGTVPEKPNIFKGGREFPVPEVDFNKMTADLVAMKAKAKSGNGKYFEALETGVRIIFKNDTYDACIVEDYDKHGSIKKYKKIGSSGTCLTCSGACAVNYPIINDGVIFIEGNAWVDGVVDNKRISVAAANLTGGGDFVDMYIGLDNLRYTNYSCENIVGLIGQRNVTVVKECPNEFVIDAALIAQTGEVGISSNMSSKSTITFNGAITSYLTPKFQHGNSGFAIRLFNFDNSLLYCSPPDFPTGTDYTIDLWEEL